MSETTEAYRELPDPCGCGAWSVRDVWEHDAIIGEQRPIRRLHHSYGEEWVPYERCPNILASEDRVAVWAQLFADANRSDNDEG